LFIFSVAEQRSKRLVKKNTLAVMLLASLLIDETFSSLLERYIQYISSTGIILVF